MKKSKHNKSKIQKLIGTAFMAFMFIGLGVGMLYDEAGAGILIGMGVGSLAAILLGIKYRSEL